MTQLKKKDKVIVNKYHGLGKDWVCCLEEDHSYVVCNDKTIKSIHALLEGYPELTSGHPTLLAKLALFLTVGTAYHFIEDIPKYQEQYLERIEFEKNTLDYLPDRLMDHGIFDVRVMHPPKVENNELHFYAVHDYTQLPYLIRIGLHSHGHIRYELLPYAND